MGCQQTQQFDSCVTSAANDTDFDHVFSLLKTIHHIVALTPGSHDPAQRHRRNKMQKAARREPGGFSLC
jgi:hypothetical protein